MACEGCPALLVGAGPGLPRRSGPPPPGISLGSVLGVWSLGAWPQHRLGQLWGEAGAGAGLGAGWSGATPAIGPSLAPPPVVQVPGARVLLFRSQGEWGFPPWSPPALRFSLGLFLETFASVFVLCGAGVGRSQCALGLAPQSGLGEGSPRLASPERAEGKTPREGPEGTAGCVAPAPGSMWSPGLGSGPGGEVWVWPMALPEGTFQNHSLPGARLKVRLRNSRPGHALTPHVCVHTLAVASCCCPGVPRHRGLELPVSPTPRPRQPPPRGPVTGLGVPRGLGKPRGPLGQPPLTPSAHLRARSPLVCA